MIDGVKDSVIMPVNLPRLITNVKALNSIKQNTITDLEPRHFFTQVQNLLDSIIVLPGSPRKSKLRQIKNNYGGEHKLHNSFQNLPEILPLLKTNIL